MFPNHFPLPPNQIQPNFPPHPPNPFIHQQPPPNVLNIPQQLPNQLIRQQPPPNILNIPPPQFNRLNPPQQLPIPLIQQQPPPNILNIPQQLPPPNPLIPPQQQPIPFIHQQPPPNILNIPQQLPPPNPLNPPLPQHNILDIPLPQPNPLNSCIILQQPDTSNQLRPQWVRLTPQQNARKEKKRKLNIEKERDHLASALNERFEDHVNSRKVVQDRLHEICNGLREKIDKLEESIISELQELFDREDNRLQTAFAALNELPLDIPDDGNDDVAENNEEIVKIIQKAKAGLLMVQSYELVENKLEGNIADICKLATKKKILPLSVIGFEERKPTNLVTSFTDNSELSISFTLFNEDEMDILKVFDSELALNVILSIREKDQNEDTALICAKKHTLGEQVRFAEPLKQDTIYCLKMRIEYSDLSTNWSDSFEFTSPDFKKLCVWKRPYGNTSYFVRDINPRIVVNSNIHNINYQNRNFVFIGSTLLPSNKVTSWSIIIKTRSKLNRNSIFIGVAPFDINQNENFNYYTCGWYFQCHFSLLCSGPPHNYIDKKYGPRKGDGQYVHTGDSVGVVMDTMKGELSFFLNGVNFGVAYEGIPLDKPLVPCVNLSYECESIELDPSDVEENVDSSIPIPPKIRAKREDMWGSISVTWDVVDGASFYQIEVDGKNTGDASETNSFIKRGLSPYFDHHFRIRTVKGNTVSKWSDAVKLKALETLYFLECAWKKCPEYIDDKRKYSVNENNPRIATKNDSFGDFCAIIGNAPLPSNKVTSWNINILKSRNNNESDIFIGVAPFDINQNERYNHYECGWYFYCYNSTLCSGPPHKYRYKKYGLRKNNDEYVRIGDSVGVVVDTAKGELSIALGGVNLGVAYEGVPLDKPLAPCVLLRNKGVSVELNPSKIEDTTADF